jgi:P-type E1-E2 ATPase
LNFLFLTNPNSRFKKDVGTLSAIAFDKTGTLTEGKPKLTHIAPPKILQKENYCP